MFRCAAFATILLLAAPGASAQEAPRAGDTVEILRQLQTSQQREGSTSSTSNSDAVIERVVAVRADGVELEYAVPQGRDGGWQFPVRVFRPIRGALRLVDGKELEARVDAWLQQHRMTRAACGHWVFTWNAFRIECDPQSVLKTVAALQLEPESLREGAPFNVPGARAPVALAKKGAGRFVAALTVDPETVRRERAENDLAMAEINGEKLTPDAARRAHAGEAISGTITVTFELDDSGHVGRRTTVKKVEIKGADGRVESQAVTEVLQRRPVAKPPRDPNLI